MNDQTLAINYQHQPTSSLMVRLGRSYIRPYVGRIFIAIFFMVVVAAAQGISAWLMKPIIDDVFIAKDRDMLKLVSIAVLATFAIKGFANYTQSALMSWVGMRIVADAQNQLYSHLIKLDLGFFHNNPTGTLVSRFTADIIQIRNTVSIALTSLGKDLMSLGH